MQQNNSEVTGSAKKVTALFRARQKRGLRQRDVANAVDIDQGYYSRIENGAAVSPEIAERVAKFFGHEVTEMQILYPERYALPDVEQKASKGADGIVRMNPIEICHHVPSSEVSDPVYDPDAQPSEDQKIELGFGRIIPLKDLPDRQSTIQSGESEAKDICAADPGDSLRAACRPSIHIRTPKGQDE